MGRDLVEPTWPPIDGPEAARALHHFPATGGGPYEVVWHSPRPMSAAALVRARGATFFLKRHHRSVRGPSQLAIEHAFAVHLRRHRIPVAEVLGTSTGGTVVVWGDFVYEAQRQAPGVDAYAGAPSWSPFLSLAHARSAGQALGRLHRAARDFGVGPRPPGILVSSAALAAAPDLGRALERLARARPGLARALRPRGGPRRLVDELGPATRPAAAALARLPACWGHGDWHASNLTWTGTGPGAEVAGVMDLGLANRTFAVHDLAVAIERNCVDWLDLGGRGAPAADLEAMAALVGGYAEARPLSASEARATVAVLPVCHVDHALSELEYFADVAASPHDADLAYEAYLLGHVRWFAGPAGRGLLARLGRLLGVAGP
jgi:Ser/Thr protein kinase RdoA (MazF antagonist)